MSKPEYRLSKMMSKYQRGGDGGKLASLHSEMMGGKLQVHEMPNQPEKSTNRSLPPSVPGCRDVSLPPSPPLAPMERLSARLRARAHRCAMNTAPRLLVFLICSLSIFLLFPHVPAIADAASSATGHISGQLLDGSQNNAPVANQTVALQIAQGNSSSDLMTQKTDAQGRYSFSALQSDATVQYAVYTLYQKAQYVTDMIDLSKNADQQVNLTVYDATTSTANIAVVQTTILVEKPNQQTGMLSVSEDFFFENLSKTTYVGSLDASKGKPNALLFTLPANARLLSLGTGFEGYRGIQVDTGFASDAAVLPGTSRFSFSFQVPYSGASYHFSYTPVYPTVAFSLLTPLDILTTPQGQGLSAQGSVNTQTGTFQTFKAQTLSASQTVQADLAGLPVPAKATPVQTQNPVNPAMLWLVALLILLLALAGIGGYLYNARSQQAARARQKATSNRKSSPPTASKKGSAVTKETLLQELLELDKAHEAGRIKKAAYQEQRARLKARLRNLISEQPEKRVEVVSKSARSSGKGEQ